MIASAQNLPLVRWSEKRDVPLSEGWLCESIDQSAEVAGMLNWHLSGDVARAIAYFLRCDYTSHIITPQCLRELMARSLVGIGYPEVAHHAVLVAPRVSIFLPELARKAPYEMHFFGELDRRLHEALDVVVRGVRLEGLRPCVKLIEQANRWSPCCESLSDEIVLYSRETIQSHNQGVVDLVIS